MEDRIKVSVFLPGDFHKQLKLAAVESQTSIQSAMEDAARAWVNPKAKVKHQAMKPKEIRSWQGKLRRILESGHALATLNCTASIRAMEILVQESKENEPKDSEDVHDVSVDENIAPRQMLREAG